MRNEQEVINQILTFAENNDMVRAVLLNGSRVNPNVENDIFSDYDIIFIVTEPKYFLKDQEWINYFGEILIMQQNSINENDQEWYIFLMIFSDGIRIDLSFRTPEDINAHFDDSLTVKLLDKDNIIKEFASPNEASYYTRKPTKEQFAKRVNNFWWVSTYIAKGIWREELTYAKHSLDVIVRYDLEKLLEWYIGMNHNWEINIGTYGKWLEKLLPIEFWDSYKKTYAGYDYEEIWYSLFEAGKLARLVGIEIANHLGYEYPNDDDERVTEFLHKIHNLPKDATSL